MNGLPKRDAEIAALEEQRSALEAIIGRRLQEKQEECPHSIVVSSDGMFHPNESMRICPVCGREEHSSRFGNTFVALKTHPDRLIVEAKRSEDYYGCRVDGSRIWDKGENPWEPKDG